jgi:hypothetical protein
MSLHIRSFAARTALVTLAVTFAIAGQSHAVGINDYRLQRTFTLPAPGPGSFGNVLLDPLPDGRLLLLNGVEVLVETAVQSGSFTSLGSISSFVPGFAPSFLAVSPDGTRAATGTNKFGGSHLFVFDTADPTNFSRYAMQEFAGEWIDHESLAIATYTSGSAITLLDMTTSSMKEIVTNIGGASAGVAFDAAGNLYTGNGFDFAPDGTEAGWVKAFTAADWQNARDTSTPLDFETDGIPIADLLTANPIGFDPSGNLFVGGGEFFPPGDMGYAALVDAASVADALANPSNVPPISASSSASILRKFISPPVTVDFAQAPVWNYNMATGELYLNYAFGDGTVYVYAIPEPGSALLVCLGGMFFVQRRTR